MCRPYTFVNEEKQQRTYMFKLVRVCFLFYLFVYQKFARDSNY
jgi:hypothetical protein